MFEQCLYFNSNALARTVNDIWTKEYSALNLSPAHAFMLRVILNNPGIMPKNLAKELSLSPSTITRFIDNLVKNKFVVRKVTIKDGREMLIYPTKNAMDIHQQLEDIGKKLSMQMKDILGEKTLLETINNLREFQKVLKS